MKKLFLLPFLFLLALPASAQRFRAGLTGGLTITDVPGMDARDGDEDFNKIGLLGGGILSTAISSSTDFSFEINYIQKGSAQRPDSLNNGQFRFAVDYIEIPLIFRHRLTFAANKKTLNRFGIEGGVSAAKLVHYKEIANNYSQPITKDELNPFEVSLHLGVDFFFTDNFLFSLRYSNSVIPAVKRNTILPGFYRYSFNQGNNMVYQLGFKIIFGKKKVENPAE